MSRTRKILLFVILPALVSCILLCFAGMALVSVVSAIAVVPQLLTRGLTTNPQVAKQIGARIADYTLPSGYEEMMGMDLFYMQMVAIARSDSGTGMSINMMQMSMLDDSYFDPERMEKQLQQPTDQQYSQRGTYEPVGQHRVTIKGSLTDLTLSESTQTTERMREAVGAFRGKNGVVMLMFTGATDTWDWRVVEDFCASIR